MLSPNTLFKKRQSHLVTYESGGNKTAVDMILIKRKYKKENHEYKSDTRRGMCPLTLSCGNGHAFKGLGNTGKTTIGVAPGATQD